MEERFGGSEKRLRESTPPKNGVVSSDRDWWFQEFGIDFDFDDPGGMAG
jgi:hypothetical protein